MARGRRLLGQLVLVLAITAGAFVGARLGMLGTRDAGASHNFSDVPNGAFYHDFVAFLVDNGITAGCAPSLFCGEQAVTRGQTAVLLQKLYDTFEIVRVNGAISGDTNGSVTVTCPAGKRPLAGGGNTNAFNLFLTDLILGEQTLVARWEFDNDAVASASTQAWALCAPA